MANSEELKKQNDLLKKQLEYYTQQRDTIGSIGDAISANINEMGRGNEFRKRALANSRNLRSISDKLLENTQGVTDLTSQQLKKLEKKAINERAILKEQIEGYRASENHDKTQIKNLESILKESEDLVKITRKRAEDEEKIEKSTGFLFSSLKGIDGLLKKAGFGDLASKLNIEEAIKDAKDYEKNTISTSQALKNIGDNLKQSISTGDVLAGIFTKLFQAAKRADTNVANLRRNFGISANEGIKLNNQFAKTAITSGDITANVESLQEANQAINEELGIQVKYNDELLVGVNALIKRNKISQEAASAIAKSTLATGVAFDDYLNTAFEVSAELMNQSGIQLSANKILEETNKISGQLRANLSRTPDGLVKAVATAKLLGVEIEDIANIAGQLLDFESSITKELEAELLIGKDLNLEQARLLALQGKSDEAVSSLISQVGTLEDFQRLNVIQQNALASAVGMTADQLGATVEKQAAINSQKQDGLAVDAQALKEGASALSIQEKLASAVEKLNSILQMTGFIVGGIAGTIAFLLSPFTGGLSLAAFAAGGAALFGGAQLVMDGIAPPNRGPFTITDSFGATAITAKGDGVAVSPNISQGSNNDLRETNRLLKAYLEKGTKVNVVNTDFNNQMSATSYAIQ